MTVGKDVFKCFWRSMKTVQRWRQKASHSRLEVQSLRRLDRRLFSVWNAGRPVCDERESKTGWLTERRMLRICRRAAKQLDTVRDTWVFMDMSLSRNMPRSRTDFAGLTISPQTENVSLGTKCCWWFEAHPITSVLAAFSCKRFGDGYSFCIHDSMSQHTDTGNPLDTWPTAAPFLPGLFRVSVFTNGWLARPRLIKYQNCVAVLY